MTNQELRIFIDAAYERASKIGLGNAYISWSEKNELIRNAKYYRKLIIQKEFSFVKKIPCLNEETNKTVLCVLNRDYSLKEIILALIGEDFFMTKQQIQKFIKS